MQVRKGIKKGVTVKVIAGKSKGQTGKILQVLPSEEKVVVEKLNLVKRHTKPSATNKAGGIVEKEAPIHWSNVVPIES